MELLPLVIGVAVAGMVFTIVRDRVKKPQEWAAGGFFVYYAFGWFAKLVYEAVASPRFGAPLPVFIGCGVAGAAVYALIVRAKAPKATPSPQ
jgi:hypothetical protein